MLFLFRTNQRFQLNLCIYDLHTVPMIVPWPNSSKIVVLTVHPSSKPHSKCNIKVTLVPGGIYHVNMVNSPWHKCDFNITATDMGQTLIGREINVAGYDGEKIL